MERVGAGSVFRGRWKGPLNDVEQQQVLALNGLLAGFLCSESEPDHWRWIPDANGREDEAHLFFSCYFSKVVWCKVVWCKVLQWLGLSTTLDAE
ncbi:hypothetical protein L195_g055486, partial [Trifolium pratense]